MVFTRLTSGECFGQKMVLPALNSWQNQTLRLVDEFTPVQIPVALDCYHIQWGYHVHVHEQLVYGQ